MGLYLMLFVLTFCQLKKKQEIDEEGSSESFLFGEAQKQGPMPNREIHICLEYRITN